MLASKSDVDSTFSHQSKNIKQEHYLEHRCPTGLDGGARRKVTEVNKSDRIHPLGIMLVVTKFHGDPLNRFGDLPLWI